MNEEEKNISKENKKKTLILTLIAIVTLLLVVIGATYAFFASQNTGKQDVNINAESGTTDVLSFSLNDKDVTSDQVKDEENDKSDIMITANMDNFNEGNISVGDGVTGTATLIANNATNNAKDNYYVYLNITNNELRYTNFKNDAGEILEGKEEDGKIVAPDETHTTKVPELILTVTQPGEEKEELQHIDGLDYYTDVDGHGLNGFDITEATGLIPIAKNYEITATGSEPTVKATQNWEIKITLVNLDSSQNKNTGKEFSGKLILQKDVIPTNLAEACVGSETIGTCAKKLEQVDYSLSHVIYHNSESLAKTNIVNKELSPNDNSYRFSGSSEEVKNYVCLDGTSEDGECQNGDADLYRIIGFFLNETGEYEMKLIKATEGTTAELGDNSTAEGGAYSSSYYYHWNSSKGTSSSDPNTNMWQYSNLNKINLNQFYLSYITTKVSDLSEHITEHDWITGGFPSLSTYNAQQVYNKELGEEKLTTSDSKCYAEDDKSTAQTCTEDDLIYKDAKIGLMYLSDYGYAAYPEAWNQYVPNSSGYGSEAVKENNWMFLGKYEWTVSRDSGSGYFAWNGVNTGNAFYSTVHSNCGVRPVFYLESSTKITSGDGSKTNPFRLSWN